MRLLRLIIALLCVGQLREARSAVEFDTRPEFNLLLKSYELRLKSAQAFTPNRCHQFLVELNQDLFERPLHQLNLSKVSAEPEITLYALAEARNHLRETLIAWAKKSKLSENCRVLGASTLLHFRATRELLGAWALPGRRAQNEFKSERKLGISRILPGDIIFARNWDLTSTSILALSNPPTFFNQVERVIDDSPVEQEKIQLLLEKDWLRFLVLRPTHTAIDLGPVRSTAEALELSPNYSIAFETTDYKNIRYGLRRDAISVKLSDWVSVQNDSIPPSYKSWMIAATVWPLSRLPWIGKYLNPWVPENISFKNYWRLQDWAKASHFLANELYEQDKLLSQIRLGLPMSFNEMLGSLEKFREFEARSSDSRLYGNYLTQSIHGNLQSVH